MGLYSKNKGEVYDDLNLDQQLEWMGYNTIFKYYYVLFLI